MDQISLIITKFTFNLLLTHADAACKLFCGLIYDLRSGIIIIIVEAKINVNFALLS